MLLYYFHKASSGRRIVPILLSSANDLAEITAIGKTELFPQLATYWIAPVARLSWLTLADLLLKLEKQAAEQLEASAWD